MLCAWHIAGLAIAVFGCDFRTLAQSPHSE